MNENINLCEILKDCPKETELYSPLFGKVALCKISLECNYPIKVRTQVGDSVEFNECGIYYTAYADSECMLLPSKDQRDWSKWKCPKPKKPKFDPNILTPFDKVLVRTDGYNLWTVDLFSFFGDKDFKCIGGYFRMCIPYNDDTKHLVGTSDEAPEHYRYWED